MNSLVVTKCNNFNIEFVSIFCTCLSSNYCDCVYVGGVAHSTFIRTNKVFCYRVTTFPLAALPTHAMPFWCVANQRTNAVRRTHDVKHARWMRYRACRASCVAVSCRGCVYWCFWLFFASDTRTNNRAIHVQQHVQYLDTCMKTAKMWRLALALRLVFGAYSALNHTHSRPSHACSHSISFTLTLRAGLQSASLRLCASAIVDVAATMLWEH